MLVMFVVEPRKEGPFAERSSPEFLTLVALAATLGLGIVAAVFRRRSTRR
jgi:hypothetical protein